MLSPRGGRADNGWRKGDELCHQTRGLKDGPPECYQSCLDQDVRLSRSSVFSLLLLLLLPLALRALLPPFTLVLFSSSFTSLPPFLPPLLFPFFDSITSSVFLFPSPPPPFLPPHLPSFCLVFALIQGLSPVIPLASPGPYVVWVQFLFHFKLFK